MQIFYLESRKPDADETRKKFRNGTKTFLESLSQWILIHLDKYETDSYFLHVLQNNTAVIHTFCKSCEPEIVCHSKNQSKNNFTYTNFTKHVNNQTNFFGNFEENMDLSVS